MESFLHGHSCHTLSCVLVFDASTLILLAKIGLLDLVLGELGGTPSLPRAVEAECAAGRTPDALFIREHIRGGHLIVEEARELEVVYRLERDFRLGRGEAEAVALALEKGGLVVATDDRKAIQACKALRLDFVTAPGFLVRAVKKGLLSQEHGRRRLEELAIHGRYKPELIEQVRRDIGGEAHGEGPEDHQRTS